eukprot:PhM_4_TR9499/c1_g1_i2/m.25899/K12384/SCARB2, LIMP2, CD36L2; lysosome membrane protein 2
MSKNTRFLGCCGFAAVFCLTIGVLGLVLVPSVIKSGIADMRRITSADSPLYESWQDSDKATDKVYMSVYFHNLTNANDVVNGAMPTLTTVGPYVYLEHKLKPVDSISWHPNGTVSYTYTTTYTFMPAMSINKDDGRKLTEGDRITNTNLGLIFALAKMRDSPAALNGFLNFANVVLGMSPYYPTYNVTEWLFGWSEPLTVGAKTPGLIGGESASATKPTAIYSGKHGHMPGLSASDSFGDLTLWAGQHNLSIWGDEYANMINGSDGTFFHSDVQNDDVLTCFVDQIQRCGDLVYYDDLVLHGVTLKRFVLAEHTLRQSLAFKMPQDGFIPVPGTPVFMTLPYYLHASQAGVNITLDGMKPGEIHCNRRERADCEIIMGVEPMSGFVMSARKRLVMNVMQPGPVQFQNIFKQNVTLAQTSRLSKTWFPIAIVEEGASASKKTCDKFIHSVYVPLRVGRYGGITLLVVFVVIMITMPVYVYRQKKQKEEIAYEEQPLIN